jgi:tetratricopeptide (TPR) repeat protein
MALAVVAHLQPALLPWIFTAYVVWSPWHYTGQNFGLTMMFLRRAGLDVTPVERRHLRVAFIASYVMLLAAFNQGGLQDPLVLSLGLPAGLSLAIQLTAGATFLVGGAMVIRPMLQAARIADRRRLLPAVTLYVTQACWFVIPIALAWWSAVPAPQTRYSTGILAVMHSAQYLWITQYYARRDAARRTAGSASGWNAWAYWGMLGLGGVALFLPGPWLASYAGRFDFTSSVLIVTAIVNIHHFMIDGVVWKLRDPRVTQALVEPGPGAMAPSSPGLSPARGRSLLPGAAVFARIVASRALTRAGLGAAALALVMLAAVDQWRYALAQRVSDRTALETASALNPYDGAVHIKLARAAIQTGDRPSAERALRAALRSNPHDIGPNRSLQRFLIETGRHQEAYAHSREMLRRWPGDVDTLINAGVLGYQLGDRSAAERWWTLALAHDASLRDVELYLAELIDDANRAGEAVPHYRRYLELVASAPPASPRPKPRQVALVVLKFGDALGRAGQPESAASQYDLAARIARQHGLGDIETQARARALAPAAGDPRR